MTAPEVSAVSDIADTIAAAVRVPFYTVRPGDSVFDTFGRPYPVGSVGGRRRVTIRPVGLWPITGDAGDTITIIRAS